ncbi:MAG TPA: hypothetical protein VGL56_06655 [Fimbriimonadaceae bacterium]
MPIISIGISIGVIVVSWGYFWNYGPDIEEAKAVEDQAAALHKIAHDEKGPAEQRVNVAQTMVNTKVAEWQQIVAKKTPPNTLSAGGINMGVDAWHMTIDVRVFRNSIQKAVNKQLKVGGVKVITGPTIPEPGDDANTVVSEFFNYPALPFPVVIFDLGQVTVQGTYKQIEDNMKAWKDMPNYLAVADGLALTGTSPILTGTYSVSMIGYIRASVVYPTVQEAASAAAPALGGGPPGPAGAAGGPGGRGPGRGPGGRGPGGRFGGGPGGGAGLPPSVGGAG